MSVILNTGYKLPTAVIANGSTTGNEWSNPDNILLVDGDVAESNQGAGTASDITIGNFNFNIPENSVITGILMKVIGYQGQQTSPVLTLSPVAVDNTSGEDVFYPYQPPYTGLTTDLEEHILGTTSYLFATSWTVDQINNFKLQLLANGSISLDCVLVNVYYYTPTSDEPEPVEDGLCVSCDSPIQAQPFTIAVPVTGTDTGVYVKSFNTPRGIPITMDDVGECGGSIIVVLDQGKAYGNGNPWEETCRVIDIVSQPNGTVYLDFGSLDNRGLGFVQPYTSDPDNISPHNANSEVVISNAAVYENEKIRTCQIDVLVSPPISVSEDGVEIVPKLHDLDFRGNVSVLQDPSDPHHAIINIGGGGGTLPPVVADTSSSGTGAVQATTLTWEHTSLGINRGLLVQIITEQSKTVSGVTFNGDALTQLVSETDIPSNIRVEQWFLVAPDAGTHDIIITMSAAAYITAGAETLVGVDQTTPTGAVDSSEDESQTPSLTLVTQYDNSVVVDALGTAITPILYTKGSNQTENWHITSNGNTRQGSSSFQLAGTTPDSVVMNWDITQDTDWVMTAVEIKGITTSSGGGGDVEIEVSQASHGFTQGEILRSNGTDNVYAKAIATNGSLAEVVGIVKEVIDPDTFILAKDAIYTGLGIPVGTPGNAVFLSDTVAGEATLTEPTTPGRISKPIGVLTASGAEMTFSADIRGNVVASDGGVGVESVTGLNTDNTDPANPIVRVSVDNVTIGGLGTPGSPLVALGGGGISGGGNGGTKIAIDTTPVTIVNTGVETDLVLFTVPGGTLGSNNAVRFKVFISGFTTDAGGAFNLSLEYGGSSPLITASFNPPVEDFGQGWIEGYIVGDGDSGDQKISFTFFSTTNDGEEASGSVDISKVFLTASGTTSIDSTVDQDVVVKVQWTGGSISPASSITADYYVAEKVTAGGGNQTVSEQNIGGFSRSVAEGLNYGPGATSSVDGNQLYARVNNTVGTDSAYMMMFERDLNSGLYYHTQTSAALPSPDSLFTGGITTDGTYVFHFYTLNPGGSHACIRYDAGTLDNPATMTFNDGVVPLASGAFFDGTHHYLYVGGGTWKKYSRSGTAFTFVANLTGASIGTVAWYDTETGHMMAYNNSGQVLQEYSFDSSIFTLLNTQEYVVPVMLGQTQSVVGVSAVSSSSRIIYLMFATSMDMGTNLRYDGGILKAFTKPSEI